MLRWDPLTGSLQLSRQATQDLFRSLGGRLTERSGSGLTVFFPLANQAPAAPAPRTHLTLLTGVKTRHREATGLK